MSLLSIELTKDEFNKIIRLAKAAGEYDQFLKGVTLSCNNCGAFIVKAPALLTMIDHLINFIDNGNIPHSLADDQVSLYDTLLEIRDMMFKTVILTNDELARLLTIGLPEYQFVLDSKGQPITDTEGNLQIFLSTDVLFGVEKRCECRNILSRLT